MSLPPNLIPFLNREADKWRRESMPRLEPGHYRRVLGRGGRLWFQPVIVDPAKLSAGTPVSYFSALMDEALWKARNGIRRRKVDAWLWHLSHFDVCEHNGKNVYAAALTAEPIRREKEPAC